MKTFIKKIKKVFSNIKKVFANLLEKINYEEHKGLVIGITIAVGLLVLIGIVFLISSKSMSDLERKELTDVSNDLVYYLDYFDVDDKDDDKYIIFALNYSKNNNNRSSLSSEELANVINSKVNKNFSSDSIKNLGISDRVASERITYNPGADMYELSMDKLPGDIIASKQVNYYKVLKMSKINMKKFSIVYQKYIIDNPYNVLNYYLNHNVNSEEYVDIIPYRNYLSGVSSLVDFKKNIRVDDIQNYSKKDKKLKVTFVVRDNKILVDKVGRCTIC